MNKRPFIEEHSTGIVTAFKEPIPTDQTVKTFVMNKSINPQQTAARQSSKVNRNLSPSLAQIQNLHSSKVVPPHNEITRDKKDNIPPTPKPKPTTAKADGAQGLSAGPASKAQNTFPPLPEAKYQTPVSASAPIAAWIIASITLTLALFSGNYAWQTHKQVETLNLRLEQLEAPKIPSPPTEPQENNDKAVKTEQALLNLKQAQGQQASTISTLKENFTTATKQMNSRLVALEGKFESIASQAKADGFHQETPQSRNEKKSFLTQSIDSKSSTEDTKQKAPSEKQRGSKSPDSISTKAADNAKVKNWNINIASFSDPITANSIYERVQKLADTPSIQPITVNGKTLHRIRAVGYSSREGAEKAALALQTQLGLSGLWVSHD